MSGEKGADVHKKELEGEEVEVKVEEESDEETDDSGSLSIPGISKKHILLGAVLILLAYGAVRWISSGDNEGSRGENTESDGETEEVDISEDIDFTEFEDIEEEETEEGEERGEEDMSFEETQERAADEISEDTPY